MSNVSPEAIIEEIIDELALGDLGQAVDAFRMERVGPGTVLLDYGEAGRFRLHVTRQSG
ncbi:hypothetical protein [Terrabacter sp. 2YAF2]|uniref:hypothetical protein n=1 Tax=Terrabacter sp. 2YAF2 TaxID=3233026 RepID=UPI003F9E55F6